MTTRKGFSIIKQMGAASGCLLVCNNCEAGALYSNEGLAIAARSEAGICPACGNQHQQESDFELARKAALQKVQLAKEEYQAQMALGGFTQSKAYAGAMVKFNEEILALQKNDWLAKVESVEFWACTPRQKGLPVVFIDKLKG